MTKLPLLLAALCFAVLSCSSDDDPPSAGTPTGVGDAASPEAPSPTAAGPAATVVPSPTDPDQPVEGLPDSVQLERVFPDLTFERLTGLYPTPLAGDLWLATEQVGRVDLIFPGSEISPEPDAGIFLDISGKVSTGGNEEGLLGLALAPDFLSSGVFYVYYSAANPRRSVLSRFESGGNAGLPESETVILEVPQPFGNHNGGQIAFGPDGYLYVGLGDGGSGNDPMGNGQNTETLLGSLLRIDVSGEDGYEVPADNPLVGQGDARGEIWAYGLRNPWRFSFDTLTGDLWLGDVGQSGREEIDFITRGGNYGWNIMEGFDCLSGDDDCDGEGLLLPVVDYENGGGDCSVTGGFVYRGSALPELSGAYLYADYCSGKIWALRYDGSEVTEQAQIADADFSVSSFAQGSDGEIYVLEHAEDGGIYRLAP